MVDLQRLIPTASLADRLRFQVKGPGGLPRRLQPLVLLDLSALRKEQEDREKGQDGQD